MSALAIPLEALLAGTAGLSTVAMVGIGMAVAGGSRSQRRARLDKVVARAKGQALVEAKKAETSVQVWDRAKPKTMERLAGRLLPQPDRLRQRLAQTGRATTLCTYTLWMLISGLGTFSLAILALGLPPLPGLLFGMTGAVLLPHLWVGRARGKFHKMFLERLPEAIDIIVRGLRSGLPVTESVVAVGNEVGAPVGPVFARVASAIRFGTPADRAIAAESERYGIAEMGFLAITLSIQQETGGNLAETLANLSDILRRRRQMKVKVKAMSSEARSSAVIVGSLPFIMFIVLMLVNRGYIMQLFSDPRGTAMVIAGIVSMLIGVFVMSRMVKFDI